MIRKSNLKLVPTTDSVLNSVPQEFNFSGDIDPDMLSNVMHDRMKELGGVGLSANQVGLNLRMFVLGAGDVKMSVFNPEIIDTSDEHVSLDEGCLSFPGIYVKVSRPVSCKVRFKNTKNETIEQELSGLTARIFLHEYDHMLGVTFKSKVSQMKWDMASKRKQKRTAKIIKSHVQKRLLQIKEEIKNAKRVPQ